jgi:hypothetical protein
LNNESLIRSLYAPPTRECIELSEKSRDNKVYKIDEGISPHNLFLYLFSRFGKPNGLLSLMREETSDQLFHWHYTLCSEKYTIQIMCATYRVEVFISNELVSNKGECIKFIKDCIKDIKNFKNDIQETRKNIENWEMVINPFRRIQKQINFLLEEIEQLNTEVPNFEYSHIDSEFDEKLLNKWITTVENISTKIYSVRCLTPVYIETFINFIIEVLCKDEIKNNFQKYENVIRENINEKIKSLHKNCRGFTNIIDRDDIVFKNVYTIFNKRNDLLHGNFIIKQLKYGEVGFMVNMPLFKSISSFQEEISTLAESSGKIEDIRQDIDDSQMFMRYILLDLEDNIRSEVKDLLESHTLGWNKDTKRFGILFDENYVDFKFNQKENINQKGKDKYKKNKSLKLKNYRNKTSKK